MKESFRNHWPEYLIEGALLGMFMISAAGFDVLLEYPASPAHAALASGLLRRVLMGGAMGATAILLIYSGWGKRSGAHFNPAVTLTFLRLGKIAPWDAVFYLAAQMLGGLAGVYLATAALGNGMADPAVHYVATLPGPYGVAAAFASEVVMSFGIMAVVLVGSNSPKLQARTGVFCGVLVGLYIVIFGPVSGMSINPARTLASAVPAREWSTLWIYFTAPLTGMLAAAEVYVRAAGLHSVYCAKLHHVHGVRCIFRCGYCTHAKERAAQTAPQEQAAFG